MKFSIKTTTLTCCCLILICGFAQAANWHRLAYSKKMDAEVVVDSSGGNWCKDTVIGKVNLGQNSPLLQGGVDSFIKKVGSVLQKDCPSASGARFDVYNDGKKTIVASYNSLASKNWSAQKVEVAKGKSLDDVPDKQIPTPAPKPTISANKPVRAGYFNLVQAVLAPSQEVISKESTMIDYLKIKHCKEYRRGKDNEIQLAKLEQHYTQEAKNFFDTTTPEFLTVSFSAKLGKYDFSKGMFPFAPFKNGAEFFYNRPSSWACGASSSVFPPKITLNISGGEFIKSLDVSSDKAEKLIKTLRYREALVSATLQVVGSSPYSEATNKASVNTILHSVKVINKSTGKTFYEFPNSWLGPKVAEKQAAMIKAKEERQRKISEDLAKKEQKRLARADRIERGVEPIKIDGATSYAHYQKLSAPTDSYMVDGVDTRRPLLIVAETVYKDGFVQTGGNHFSTKTPTEISFSQAAKGKPPIKIIIQNWKDFVKQKVPQEILSQTASQDQFFLSRTRSYVAFTVKPVGFMDDPWKGGNAIVVHASNAEYSIKPRTGDLQKWTVKASTPPKTYTQNRDSRTARELDVASLRGGMEVDDVQDTLEDKLNLETSFDENVKVLKSSEKVFVSELFDAGPLGSSFSSGKRYFEGFFVETGKSLMGLGSPIYSLKQGVLGQTASAKEKDAILEGLIKKFGEPDLHTDKSHVIVLTWGKRITDDRSQMPIGKDFKLPVSAVEAQIYYSDKGVFTVLILTDELYLKKTKVTTKTIY